MSSTPSSCSRDRSRNGYGPRDQRVQLVHRPAALRADGHQLLGQHVQRVARDARLLDRPVQHPAHDHRRLQQVAAVLREDLAGRRLADLVPGPPDALQPGCHRGRRLDLDDQVDGAHVDPQLQARGGDQRRQASGLQRLLDLEPLLPRDAAVVRPHQLLAGQLVEAGGQPLGQPPGVDEDQRGPMRPDQLQQPRMHRGPDRAPGFGTCRRSAGLLLGRQLLAQAGHVLDRHDHLELEALAAHRRPRSGPRGPARRRRGRRRSPPAAAGWPTGRSAAAGRSVSAAEPLQAERQVGAALGAGDGVHLVDDHVLHAAQRLARLAGEHQVQALRGGDQDVRRVLDQLRAAHRPACRRSGTRPAPRAAPSLRARRCGGCRPAGARRLRSTS